MQGPAEGALVEGSQSALTLILQPLGDLQGRLNDIDIGYSRFDIMFKLCVLTII